MIELTIALIHLVTCAAKSTRDKVEVESLARSLCRLIFSLPLLPLASFCFLRGAIVLTRRRYFCSHKLLTKHTPVAQQDHSFLHSCGVQLAPPQQSFLCKLRLTYIYTHNSRPEAQRDRTAAENQTNAALTERLLPPLLLRLVEQRPQQQPYRWEYPASACGLQTRTRMRTCR